MTKGLVLGKFMPLHVGHLALIDFALKNCDLLYVLICAELTEPINGNVRYNWLNQLFVNNNKIEIVLFWYDQKDLPNTSVSSFDVSEKWAEVIKAKFPGLNKIFSSEKYGGYLASILNIRHICFDRKRSLNNISSTAIRNNPFNCWLYIPSTVKPFFVKKIALVGSESTGKSTLAKRLAEHFNTLYVPEMARDIIEQTGSCSFDHLMEIAELHAKTILQKQQNANKILISDTELLITKSYSLFLFDKELVVEDWIEKANQFDLYIFLDNDCPFLQDGTRLDGHNRNELSKYHKAFIESKNVKVVYIGGDWESRFISAIEKINEQFFKHD